MTSFLTKSLGALASVQIAMGSATTSDGMQSVLSSKTTAASFSNAVYFTNWYEPGLLPCFSTILVGCG